MTVLPQNLSSHILKLVHYELGYNGPTRMYIMFKRLWIGKVSSFLFEILWNNVKHISKVRGIVVKYANLQSNVSLTPV